MPPSSDTTSRRVERILREGFEEAHPRRPAVTPSDILELCGCSHHLDAHHAPPASACAESGCECVGWHPCQVECPDCGTLWVEEGRACPGCGLTIEQLAERVSS